MKRLSTLVLIPLMLLMGGCSSKSEFYRLHPTLNGPEGSRHIQTLRILGIGEVQVADYLEKPEMVTRLSPTHLRIHEEQRWIGNLSSSIQKVLQQNLSTLLPGYTVLSYPWEEPVSDRYRVYVTVDRFDGDSNGTVLLSGHWSLADREESRVVTGEQFRYTEHGRSGTAGIVESQSRLLEQLSRRIAIKVRHYF